MPCQRATAALLRSGTDPVEVDALRMLAGLGPVTADSANGPWGSDNTVSHPPQKPYGATSPPDRDMDPGSYGPLAAPDPENWGRIDSGDVFQMPIGNTASLHIPCGGCGESAAIENDGSGWCRNCGPVALPRFPGARRAQPVVHGIEQEDIDPGYSSEDDEFFGDHGIQGSRRTAAHPVPGDLHWPDQSQDEQGTFSYQDHANAAGPSTGMTPRDPNGIRMEESRAELRDEPEAALPQTTGDDLEATAAADGTIGGGDAGDGVTQKAPLDTAALGEFGASAREEFRRKFGGPTAMGDQSVAEGLSGGAQEPSMVGQQPGMGSMDEPLMPDDQSIQTIGTQQWSGGGADSDEVAVEPGQPQGGIDDIVASFQRSAAARAYTGGGGSGGAAAAEPGDIAAAARAYLSKTADVLPQREADELIREGRGQRARNLDLLSLEGTHYADADEELGKKGLSMDDHDDDVIFA